MTSEPEPDPSERLARGKWYGLVKAFALLGGAVIVFLITRNPPPPPEASFSEIGRWSEVGGRGEIEWSPDGMERLFSEGKSVDEREYRLLGITPDHFTVEREFSEAELGAHPEWQGRGQVRYEILGPDRIRREFAPAAGTGAMEFIRKRP